MIDRVLGIDYGSKRIGLAVADAVTRIATPLSTILARNDPTRDARAVTDFAAKEGVAVFVVGLPLNMTSGESEQTALTRRFAAELARLSGMLVHLQDERLTSAAAEEVLDDAQVSPRKRKGLTDRIAAQKMLQAWLDAQPS
jgi:putative Holliday junction resolvase